MTIAVGGRDELDYEAGGPPTTDVHGSLVCVECGYVVALHAEDLVPRCPTCSGSGFRRARMFEQQTVGVEMITAAKAEPDGVTAARERLDGAGPHLVWEHGGDVREVPLTDGWTRIGRSTIADIRLDDPTVSRRHALVVRTETGELKALDDRSLNGLFVNGKRVEWTPLADGDELEIGCFRMYVVT